MNIVNFTPLSALSGGLLIGFSVALFFILNGRMIGISGIASSVLVTKDRRIDNFLFLNRMLLLLMIIVSKSYGWQLFSLLSQTKSN